MHAQNLISEHFDFALSQVNSQCTKSGEFDNLEPELNVLHFAGACIAK